MEETEVFTTTPQEVQVLTAHRVGVLQEVGVRMELEDLPGDHRIIKVVRPEQVGILKEQRELTVVP
jgi:hypothetical protein